MWWWTVRSGASGSMMARFISPRNRLGKINACGGPCQRSSSARSLAVPRGQCLAVVGDLFPLDAEPRQLAVVAAPELELDMAAAAIARGSRDDVLAGEHRRLVLRPGDDAPQRGVQPAEVIAVEVALGPHLPVRADPLAEPASADLQLTDG